MRRRIKLSERNSAISRPAAADKFEAKDSGVEMSHVGDDLHDDDIDNIDFEEDDVDTRFPESKTQEEIFNNDELSDQGLKYFNCKLQQQLCKMVGQ